MSVTVVRSAPREIAGRTWQHDHRPGHGPSWVFGSFRLWPDNGNDQADVHGPHGCTITLEPGRDSVDGMPPRIGRHIHVYGDTAEACARRAFACVERLARELGMSHSTDGGAEFPG